jgi:hypothetical protein
MIENPRDIKAEIIEYPGYYVDGTGLICYKTNGGGFRYCKKADKESTFIFHNGHQITISEIEMADKYITGWREHRKRMSDNRLTLNQLHEYLQKIIDTKGEVKQKVKWLNEYTNKILNIKNENVVNPHQNKKKKLSKPKPAAIKNWNSGGFKSNGKYKQPVKHKLY